MSTFLYIGVFFILFSQSSIGTDLGKIQFSVPSPNPIRAGEKITFQIVSINVGTENWKPGDYYFEAEIYDSEKKLIRKSPRLYSNVQTKPGESVLAYLPYNLQDDYSGKYFYKVNLVNLNQLLVSTDYYDFDILPKPPEPPKVLMKGNMALAYKKSDRSNYLWNFNLNLIGQVYGKTITANTYVDYSEAENVKLDRALLNYYDGEFTGSLGDISMELLKFTLSGVLVRGAAFDLKTESVNAMLIGGRLVQSREGTDTSAGSYMQYVAGSKISFPLKEKDFNIEPGVSVSYAADDRSSISNSGPGITPVDDMVYSGNIAVSWKENVKVLGEISYAFYDPDTFTEAEKTKDSACRFSTALNLSGILFNAGYQRVGAGFVSKGSPAFGNDKETYDASASMGLGGSSSFSSSYNFSRDNLNSDPGKLTNNILTLASTANISLAPGLPVLILGYNYNSMLADNVALLDNNTNSYLAALNYSLEAFNASMSYQNSYFADNTPRLSSLKTTSSNFRLNTMLLPNLSLSGGVTLTSVDSIANSNSTGSLSVDAGGTFQVIPEKLSLNGFVNYTRRSDLLNTTGNSTKNASLEANYNLSSSFSLSAGYTLTIYSDGIVPGNAYTDNIISTRLNYMF
ncbi:MAG: hypothetical protein A2452_03515 [Candidatus Firestonebacteria bacterium RIFOXYC2_FULL_39_67]|nr:MAG: hypothetical protein A2536_02930 [Candidatus Firestonebacteria bacterium RIFOXYD2_FULL_39_29]OGF55336.1 MAG: hypothetical protein A2452_03515 [Candidatus Firestonebacteria bacterium RIFOXYC2_FULL_39_67]